MSPVLETWRDALPALLDGLRLSLAVTGAALLVGLPLGLGLALAARARSASLRLVAGAVGAAGRGVPVLVLLQAAGLGLPAAGLPLSPAVAAAMALAWAACAAAGEAIGSGLDAVAPGQRDAAVVMGLSAADALRFVLLPQGLRHALPALLGVAVLVFQASALAMAIGLPDLAGRATGLAGGGAFAVLVLAALIYAAVAAPALVAIARLQRRRPAG